MGSGCRIDRTISLTLMSPLYKIVVLFIMSSTCLADPQVLQLLQPSCIVSFHPRISTSEQVSVFPACYLRHTWCLDVSKHPIIWHVSYRTLLTLSSSSGVKSWPLLKSCFGRVGTRTQGRRSPFPILRTENWSPCINFLSLYGTLLVSARYLH